MHSEISRFSKSNETHTGSIKPIQIQQSSGLPNPYGFSSKAKLRQGHSKTLAGVSDERLMIHSSYWIESGYTKTFKSTDLALRQTHKPTSRDIRVQGLGFAAKNIQKHSEKHSKTFKTFKNIQKHSKNIQKHSKTFNECFWMFLNVFWRFLLEKHPNPEKHSSKTWMFLNVFWMFLNVFSGLNVFLASVIFDSDCSWIAFGPYKIL